jgi:type VI secretion system protein ImpA
LGKSKDLRVLAYLGAALLRTDGLPAFLNALVIASTWLDTYWSGTYPPIDGDGMARTSALNCFADPMAVIDRLRRIPLVANAHGKFALRDLDIVSGKLAPAAREEKPTQGQVDAAFAAMPLEELIDLQQQVERAIAAVATIEKTTDQGIRRDLAPRQTPEEAAEAATAAAVAAGAEPDAAAKAGADAAARTAAAAAAAAAAAIDAAPKFEPLLIPLRQIGAELRARVAARQPGSQAEAAAGTAPAPSAAGTTSSGISVGAINSRQDAIRALDAVAEFFRRSEPSSPVPLFVERAKRLVSKSFLEVLADIAPDGVSQARSAGGLPPSNE